MKEKAIIPWMHQTTDCWDSSYGGYCGKYTWPMVPAVVLWNPSSPLFWGHAFCGCSQAWLSTAALRQVHSRRCRIPLMGTFSFRTPRQPCQNFLGIEIWRSFFPVFLPCLFHRDQSCTVVWWPSQPPPALSPFSPTRFFSKNIMHL